MVVTGIGILSPLGADTAAHWAGAREGRSGVRPITRFPVEGFRTRFAGQLPSFAPEAFAPERQLVQMDPFAQMAVAAAGLALRDAGLAPGGNVDSFRVAVAVGTSQGGRVADEEVMGQYFRSDGRRVRPLAVPLIMPAAASSWVSIVHGARGPAYPITSACTTGLASIGLATQLLRTEAPVDVFLAGGADAPVTRSLLAGWCAARATSARNDDPERASRPFDAGRDGLVIAEGAGVLVLERLPHAAARRAHVYAEVRGFGATSDAHDLTAPDPGGEPAARAILAALEDAGAGPEEVGWVSAHGTSTRLNDAAETAALKRAFGGHARRLAISALKSMTGHTMGAAGAIEAATAALALRDGVVPPTINQETRDPDCDLDYVANAARPRPEGLALVESFAFGGANAALLLARGE